MTFHVEVQSSDRRWTPLGSVHSEPVARQLAEMALARKDEQGQAMFAGVRIRTGALVIYEPRKVA